MRKVAMLLAAVGLLSPALFTASAQAAAARTFVSGTGSDSNPCSRTFPCLTFAGAIAQTSPGGEINCLDASGYGAVTITFALTISCEAGTAGIAVSSGAAITINAAAADDITLRGLDLNGLGTGDTGISINTARTVNVEKCAIRGFNYQATSAGMQTASNANHVFMFVTDSVISGNANGARLTSANGFKVLSMKNVTVTRQTGDGVVAVNSLVYVNITESVLSGNGGSSVNVAATSSTANVDRTTMANSAFALNASASGAMIRSVGNNIFNNTTAFGITAGATIESDGQNRTGGNFYGPNVNAPVVLK